MKNIARFFCGYKGILELKTKRERACFTAGFALLVLYVEITLVLQFSHFNRILSLLHLFCSIAAVPLCFLIIMILAGFGDIKLSYAVCENESSKKRMAFTIVTFALTFIWFLIWFIAFYPGSFSNDSIIQYEQVLSGEYNNWHPVLHTWLFFKIPMMLFGNPAMIVFMQIIYFSAAVAYLFSTLRNCGCHFLFMLFSWLYIVANPNTAHIVLYPWKDTAFSIFAIVIFTQLIKIYETGGTWLKNKLNLIVFSIFLFLAVGMRHNALLLVVPVLVILFIFFKKIRKSIFISAVLVIAATLVLNGPVFKMLEVEKPGHRQIEMLGLPLTVLSDVYMEDRDALSEDAVRFMASLATEEEWNMYHVSGNFNVLKFSVDDSVFDKVENEGAGNILRYTAGAICKSPGVSLAAFSRLTSLVWGFAEFGDNTIPCSIIENSYGIEYSGNIFLSKILSVYSSLMSLLGKYLFNFVGIIVLCMLFLAVARIGKCDPSKSFVILAPLIYNFGTMLLLTGPDFRFFHFNFLIIIPIIYLIFASQKQYSAILS